MLKKILPILLLLMGSGAGIGAGIFLRPISEVTVAMDSNSGSEFAEPEEVVEHEYVKMNNQFVVPIVTNERVQSLVVMSLTVEVPIGQKDAIYAKEPKLRDAFLQILFDHANMGGFEGEFTNSSNLDGLRMALREVGRKNMGDGISDVLIMEVARQDY